MKSTTNVLSSKQLRFKELFVGTLIYAVVLGFFNDYTLIVEAKSFSTIFFSAIVLEMLTYGAFFLKGNIVHRLKNQQGIFYKLLMIFSVWLVMFLSKFVFIWVIDKIFGNYMNINGFFGILILVLTVTILQRITNTIFVKLGDETTISTTA